jgi:hypothetical protein
MVQGSRWQRYRTCANLSDQIWAATEPSNGFDRRSLKTRESAHQLSIIDDDPISRILQFKIGPHRFISDDVILQVWHNHPLISAGVSPPPNGVVYSA